MPFLYYLLFIKQCQKDKSDFKYVVQCISVKIDNENTEKEFKIYKRIDYFKKVDFL